jgi:hypothetical protein
MDNLFILQGMTFAAFFLVLLFPLVSLKAAPAQAPSNASEAGIAPLPDRPVPRRAGKIPEAPPLPLPGTLLGREYPLALDGNAFDAEFNACRPGKAPSPRR